MKIIDSLSRMTLQCDGWLRNTIGHLFYATSSFVCYFKANGEIKLELQSESPNSGQNQQFFVLKNLTNDLDQSKFEGFDSCARPSNLKLDSNRQFSACVTAKFDGWPRKTIGHFFFTTSSLVHHSKSIGEFKLHLQSRNAQFGSNLVIFYPV